VKKANIPGGHPLEKARANDPPEALFVNLGCVACHGDNGPHRDKLGAAAGTTDAQVADWILNPRATKPDTTMPSFKAMIDHDQAESLARYAKELAKLPRS